MHKKQRNDLNQSRSGRRTRDGGNLPATSDLVSVPPMFKSRSKIRYSIWDSNPKPISMSTSSSVVGSLTFQASSVANTDLLAATDAYRILSVDIVYVPNSQAGLAPAASSNGAGMWFCFDPDDNTTSSVVSTAASSTATVHSMLEKWEMTLRPRPSIALYGSGTFSGYAIAEKEPWIDSDNLSVPHYGLKWGAPGGAAAYSGCLYVRYNLECIQPQ